MDGDVLPSDSKSGARMYSPPDPAVREFELEQVGLPSSAAPQHTMAASSFGSIVLVLRGAAVAADHRDPEKASSPATALACSPADSSKIGTLRHIQRRRKSAVHLAVFRNALPCSKQMMLGVPYQFCDPPAGGGVFYVAAGTSITLTCTDGPLLLCRATVKGGVATAASGGGPTRDCGVSGLARQCCV